MKNKGVIKNLWLGPVCETNGITYMFLELFSP